MRTSFFQYSIRLFWNNWSAPVGTGSGPRSLSPGHRHISPFPIDRTRPSPLVRNPTFQSHHFVAQSRRIRTYFPPTTSLDSDKAPRTVRLDSVPVPQLVSFHSMIRPDSVFSAGRELANNPTLFQDEAKSALSKVPVSSSEMENAETNVEKTSDNFPILTPSVGSPLCYGRRTLP